ncbi:MAG: restriction endonuclease subunit S [Nostoc sp.]|uniref:restriction endonuclease subunit S n=1 Tax=Nostoc sp. TaxID=1180 RepID=UPI002FF8A514
MGKKLKKNVPVLRFPEFKGNWEEKRLEELFLEFKSGYNITSEDITDHSTYPVFGGNGLRGFADKFTHDGFYFLIGRQGALCGNINRTYGKAYISEHAIACKANDTSDTEWLAQRLDYYNLNRLSESSAQPGLSVNKLLRFKLFVPSKAEQEKIASFLGAVDRRLTQLRRKQELLQTYKRGVMKKIFSQQIRFTQPDGCPLPDWERKRLEELFSEFKSGYGITSDEITEHGTYPVFGGNGLRGYTEKFTHDGFYFLIGRQGALCGNIHRTYGKTYISEYAIACRANDTANTEWLAQRLDYYNLNKLSESSAQPGLSVNKLLRFKLLVPSKEEQEKIANFLTVIDRKIEALSRQIDQTEKFKKGLLQKLFV